jgi:hypothetical protein
MRLITALLVALCTLGIAACSMHSQQVVRSESPDHATIARVIEEVGGPATVSRVDDLYLSDQRGSYGTRVFDATSCAGISLTWQGNHRLLLEYPGGCYIHKLRNLWWNKAATRNASAATVEIILVRGKDVGW